MLNKQTWKKLMRNVAKVPMGSTLTIRQIYGHKEWQKLTVGLRIALGRAFKKAVVSGKISRVIEIFELANHSLAYHMI